MKILPLVREVLKQGDFLQIRLFMDSHAQTLAELLQDPQIFKEMLRSIENSNTKLSAALFLFDVQNSLTLEQKRLAKMVLIRILMQLASRLSARGIRSTERILTPFRPGLDEIEIENTLENMMGKKLAAYEDIIMVDKQPKQRGTVLMLDISNSMQREKILLATLAIGVLAYRLKGEYYSILTFSDKVEVIKHLDKPMTIEELLDKMLEIIPKGATDIGKALDKGLEQLSKKVTHEKIGIIITDGWVTAGEDPADFARNYPKLHVLQVPIGVGGGDDQMCIMMAQEGRGKRLKIKAFEEIPKAILEVLK